MSLETILKRRHMLHSELLANNMADDDEVEICQPIDPQLRYICIGLSLYLWLISTFALIDCFS